MTRIDLASHAEATIPAGTGPTAIAVGEGAVWVADDGDGTVMKIDPATDRVVRTIHVGGRPAGISVADGRVWVSIDGAT